MATSNRRRFLQTVMLATIGSVFLPRSVKAMADRATAPPLILPPTPFRYDPSYFAIVDLHCHPSLKMYLWGRKFWRRHTPGSGMNAFDLQDDVDQLTNGTVPNEPDRHDDEHNGLVKGIVVAHYLPEEGVHTQWNTVKKIYPWIGRIFRKWADKIEHGDWTNIDQALQIIDLMEDRAKKAYQHQNKNKRVEFVIARSFKDFSDAIEDGKFPIAHAIEGAHALGRNKSDPGMVNKGRKRLPEEGRMLPGQADDYSQYIKSLQRLKDRGVCMMTLAHLFPNDISFCVEGISPDAKRSLKMNWNYNPDVDNKPLTDAGVAVVNWMLNNGMIIDLTHSTPATRDQIYNINQGLKDPQPLVFTHTGLEEVFLDHDKNKFSNYRFYCVRKEDIDAICACQGTIGVIPEVFWLAGGNTHLRHYKLKPKWYRNGIPFMVETIQRINSLTPKKDYSHISIGTDFDGYSDEPQDLYEATQLDSLVAALRAEKIEDPDIQKIMSGNALNVLRLGWKPS